MENNNISIMKKYLFFIIFLFVVSYSKDNTKCNELGTSGITGYNTTFVSEQMAFN